MNRRELGSAAASFLLLSAVRAPLSFGQDEREQKPASEQARALHQRAVVIDANLGVEFDHLPLSADTLRMCRESGLTAIKTTVGGFRNDFDTTLKEISAQLQMIETHPEVFVQIRRVEDITAAKRSRKVGIILSFEGVDMLAGKLERIELFRQLGVRVMQLSYNKTSPFGSGVLADPPSGLTELGRAAVARMNQLGVAVDLSHADAKTTTEAMAASTRPVLITHGGCAAVYAHPRNKTDAQLRALADKGGVIGIYDLPYLTASPKQPDLNDYLAHMSHALQICGEDHVGIGSDQSLQPFDTSPQMMQEFERQVAERRASGVSAPGEDRPAYVVGLNTPNRSQVIADALLQRHYPARVAEKVLGGNFLRAFGDIWKA